MIAPLLFAAILGVTNLEGEAVDPFAPGTGIPVRAVVFVFADPECPVSNRYMPEINRLHDAHRSRGVRLWVVYSPATASLAAVRSHYAAYGVRAPALFDPGLAIAERAGATCTAEAAVYVRSRATAGREWTLVYRGRIDDRAGARGIWRAAATTRDLAEVLRRVERGEEPAYRTTRAIGCYLKPLS
jgi:hypothetical protein